jgi:HEAT repeat protein
VQGSWIPWILGGFLVLAGAAVLAWSLFWDRARGRRRCPNCWYEMPGGPGLCPECGRTITHERRLLRTRRRWTWAAAAGLAITAGAAWPAAQVSRRDVYSVMPTRVLWHMLFSETWGNDTELYAELSYTRAAGGQLSAAQEQWIVTRAIKIVETSGDPAVRENTLSFLAWIGVRDPRNTPTLVRWLNDPDPNFRVRVVRSIGIYMADADAVIPHLIRIAGDASAAAPLRTEAAAVLWAYQARATAAAPVLVAMMSDPDPAVRTGAAWALPGLVPDDVAITMLTGLLESAQTADERQTALLGLGRLGSAAAAAAVSDRVAAELDSPDPLTVDNAIQALMRIGRGSEATRARLVEQTAQSPGADTAALALLVFDDPEGDCIRVLAEVLDADGPLAPAAARELWFLRHRASAAMPELIRALDHWNPDIYLRAGHSFTYIGPAEESVPHLLRMAEENPAAAHSLQMILRRETDPYRPERPLR